MLKPHAVLCYVKGEGAGQMGNKQYLLFKVKGVAYVGMKSNSIIAKNLFNHFSISVLSPFTALLFPLVSQNGNRPWCLQPHPIVSTFSLAEFNHPPLQVDWECFFCVVTVVPLS